MVTSPINPMRYWKLEEIQSMLNKIEGYENVVIEFQYQQSDNWAKRKVWECKCGIKEQLINGQWNWLLKYVFAIEANDEGDARTIAWQEAAERLVTDIWRTSINSFRKQQQELSKNNQFQIALEKMNRTPMNVVDEAPKPSITKIGEKMKTNNTTQTKTKWSETKRWLASVGIVGSTFGFIYWSYVNNLLFTLFLGCVLGGLVLFVKAVVDEVMFRR